MHGFPIGIEPDEFKEKLATAEVQDIVKGLENDFRGLKVMVGVDRLDYIKGIPLKIKAFDRYLTQHPEAIGKVVLVQLAIPTRSDVEMYKKLREDVERLIGHVNGKHGNTYFHVAQIPLPSLSSSISLPNSHHGVIRNEG